MAKNWLMEAASQAAMDGDQTPDIIPVPGVVVPQQLPQGQAGDSGLSIFSSVPSWDDLAPAEPRVTEYRSRHHIFSRHPEMAVFFLAAAATAGVLGLSASNTPTVHNPNLATKAQAGTKHVATVRPVQAKKLENQAQATPAPAVVVPTPIPAETVPAPALPVPVPPVNKLATIATMNVLGASHTAAQGDEAGLASGAKRMEGSIEFIKAKHIAAGALEEFESPQQKAFVKNAGTDYGLFPQSGGRDAIFWDRSQFSFVDGTDKSIPYFNGGQMNMPEVRLKYKATGDEIILVGIHNAADTSIYHNQEKYRDEATQIEKKLMAELDKKYHLPVIIAGDSNDAEEFFRKMTASGLLKSAAGGSNGPNQKYAPPADLRIDQILGAGISFSNYRTDKWPLINKVSDHPYVLADIEVPSNIGGQNG